MWRTESPYPSPIVTKRNLQRKRELSIKERNASISLFFTRFSFFFTRLEIVACVALEVFRSVFYPSALLQFPKLREHLLRKLHNQNHPGLRERERSRGHVIANRKVIIDYCSISCVLLTLFSDFLLKDKIQTPVDHIVNLIIVFFDVQRVLWVRGFLIRIKKISELIEVWTFFLLRKRSLEFCAHGAFFFL